MFSIFKRKPPKDPYSCTITFRDDEQKIRITATYSLLTSLENIKQDILLSHGAFRGTTKFDWIFAEWQKYPRGTQLYQLPSSRQGSVTMIRSHNFLSHFRYDAHRLSQTLYRMVALDVDNPAHPVIVPLYGSSTREEALARIADELGAYRTQFQFVGDCWPEDREKSGRVEPLLCLGQLDVTPKTVLLVKRVPYSRSWPESEVDFDDRVYYGCPTAVLPEQMDDLRLRSVEVVSYE